MNKKYYILIVILVLVSIRLIMPYALLSYVKYRINKIPEYQVEIASLSLNFYKGSYTINDINLLKIDKKIPVPFFAAKTVDFSVDYKALLHGAFAAKITVTEPKINLVTDDTQGGNEQLSINQEWQNAVSALFPLNFNKITLERGELHFRSFTSKPPFDLFLKDISVTVDNMRNAIHSENKLPSSFNADAISNQNAHAHIEGSFDPFAKQPTFYFQASLKDMKIKEANNLLRHYTKIDVASGTFSLFIEAAAAKGKITGYAKPLIKDLQIIDPKKEMSAGEAIYKGAVTLASKIFENSEQKTIATRIPIVGNIEDPDSSILSIIWNLISHAYIETLLPRLDHTIKMKDVIHWPNKSNHNNAKNENKK